MRAEAPFQADDLQDLLGLYERAARVVAMEDVFDRDPWLPSVIGLRHDCDNVILPAVDLARWENQNGIRSTYYILHTSPYWENKPFLQESLEAIVAEGHEVGIHNDALTVALQTGRDPVEVLEEAIGELRSYGHEIRSTVAHGHQICRKAGYVNDEIFDSCGRPDQGAPDRTLRYDGRTVTIQPVSLARFGLDFDANWLPRGDYLSDSGGRWSQDFDQVKRALPARGQLHVLQHPDWWAEAFQRVGAVA